MKTEQKQQSFVLKLTLQSHATFVIMSTEVQATCTDQQASARRPALRKNDSQTHIGQNTNHLLPPSNSNPTLIIITPPPTKGNFPSWENQGRGKEPNQNFRVLLSRCREGNVVCVWRRPLNGSFIFGIVTTMVIEIRLQSHRYLKIKEKKLGGRSRCLKNNEHCKMRHAHGPVHDTQGNWFIKKKKKPPPLDYKRR